MKYHTDDSKNYIQQVMNSWQSAYRMAHAITGSSELAESVLHEALLDAYIHMNKGSTRENIRRAVSECSLAQLREARRTHIVEQDWNGFDRPPENLAAQDKPYWRFLHEQDLTTRRVLMLKYAMHWTPRQIADVTDLRTGEVKDIEQSTAALLQRVSGAHSGDEGGNVRITPVDKALNRLVRLELSRGGPDLPDSSAVLQTLEQDTAYTHVHTMTARKVVGTVLRIIAALVVAVGFYLFAIMLQDPQQREAHVEPATKPGATNAPVLTLPGLGEYEMINAGRQMPVEDLAELHYYFTQPLAVLRADGWTMDRHYIRDERGIGGINTRSAVVEYVDAAGRRLYVRSMLPGSEASQRLEDEFAYMGNSAQLAGESAVRLQNGALSRVYTMIGQSVYCIECEMPLEELEQLAGQVELTDDFGA